MEFSRRGGLAVVAVPKITSVNKTEYIPPKGSIAFAPELIRLIQSGEKRSTYRYGLKYDYIKIGGMVEIVDSSTEQVSAKVVVKAKRRVVFSDLPLSFDKHETYRDKEHQRQVLSGYYAYIGRPIHDDDTFLIIEFELL